MSGSRWLNARWTATSEVRQVGWVESRVCWWRWGYYHLNLRVQPNGEPFNLWFDQPVNFLLNPRVRLNGEPLHLPMNPWVQPFDQPVNPPTNPMVQPNGEPERTRGFVTSPFRR